MTTQRSAFVWRTAVTGALLLALAACGGGSGGTASTNNASSPSNPTPTAPATPTTGDSGTTPPSSTDPSTQPSPAQPPLAQLTGLPGLTALPTSTVARVGADVLQPAAAQAPTIQAVADGNWSNPATWSGNRVPAADDIVMIASGRTVLLDTATARLGGLWVGGRLDLADQNGVLLNSRFVIISGTVQAGSETQPVRNRVTIELWGTDVAQAIMGMGTKNLGVMKGGLLKLHGENRLAWTKLDASVNAGATKLTLKDDASSWRVGDKLVLVSGSMDPRDAQELTITAVSGKQIDVSPALAKARYAQVQTFGGKTLDQRPAIGLLTRNLVVQGAADSDANAFGGHIMVMDGGHAQISGIELKRMGQRGLPGRYPIHWHEAKDRSGNYAIGNSINRSFQRAIVVHSSSNILIDGNVAFDIKNHAYVWAEDGDESNVVMTRNLGALITSPEEQHFAFPINNPFFMNSSQGEARSAVFWGRSLTRHVLRDNISAGALDGFGYFVDLFTPAPDSAVDGSGMTFDGNIAHSTLITLPIGNQINYPEATRGHGLMVTTGAQKGIEHIFHNYTGFYNTSGAWLEDRSTILKNSVVADNGAGAIMLRGVVDDVVVVGKSANTTPRPRVVPSVSVNTEAGIQIAGSDHGGMRSPLIRKATIINAMETGILWDTENIPPGSQFANVEFVNTANRVRFIEHGRFEFHEPPNFVLMDRTGTVSGESGASYMMMHDSTLADASCKFNTTINSVICPTSVAMLMHANQRMDLVEPSGQMTFLRYFSFEDDSMPSFGVASWIGNGRQYEIAQLEGGATLELNFEEAAGKSAEFTINTTGSPTSLRMDGSALDQAANVQALRTASRSAYAYDAAARKLYVRFVGTSSKHSISIQAPLTGNMAAGRAPDTPDAAATTGMSYAVHSSSASYQLRYGVPTQPVARSAKVSNATLQAPSFVSSAVSGDTTIMRGYVYAPENGIYRVALWGSGGGTSVYMGPTWVMGETWAFINSNWVRNDQLTNEVVTFQINRHFMLRQGWHEVTVVHAKMPENREGSSVFLRWSLPSNGSQWVYPQWKVNP
jgi:hypothetical protein